MSTEPNTEKRVEKQPVWKQRLEPFAQQYARLVHDVDVLCQESTDDELEILIEQAQQPGATNCWWATFAVAAIVLGEARSEQLRRFRNRAAAGGVL